MIRRGQHPPVRSANPRPSAIPPAAITGISFAISTTAGTKGNVALVSTPDEIGTWSLTSLRERLIKTGVRLVRHARYAVFQFAEAALPRRVFAGILERINGLRDPPAVAVSV